MTKKDCIGCYNNFYNGNNNLGVKECWSFDRKKKCVTKFRLSIHTPMNIKSAYQKVKIPPCYHMTGFVHCNQIPDYAR